ncbi:MAG: hypothetical protein JWM68_5435 [Verrucomicrobiales bacterium]|nr:hypothetical protein [Verrucomicrobiales bacterium]
MSSRLLSFSLCLNLVLLGVAGYWAAKSHSGGTIQPANGLPQTNHAEEKGLELAPAALAAAPVPLRWDELESEDYPTYVANLLKAGCPAPVLRRIIGGRLKELYAQEGFALVQEFHRDFWAIAARESVREYFEKTLGQQVKALSKESDTLLKQLVGEASDELSSAPENRFTDFLSPAKQEQLRGLTERYEARLQAVGQTNLSPEEKESELAQLRREMEGEQAAILSPEELAEYQLRQSSAASVLQQLHGVDFSETELRNLAKAIDDYQRQNDSDETYPKNLDQILQTVLGPARFTDFNRARSASYRELYEVASDFGQPTKTAAEIFDLRLQSEKQSDEIRADKNRPAEEKQALLDELQEQVEQAVLTKFGAGAYKSYKARGGRWINSLGRL